MKKFLLPLLLATQAHSSILLNEVHLNVPGPDGNYEFIELRSTTNAVEACTGMAILIINNDKVDADTLLPLNRGAITEVLDLNQLSTGSNGLLLLGNGYTGNPLGGPWAGAVDSATAMGDPSGLGDSDIASNDGLSILLVSGISAADLLTLKDKDVDVDNDGALDWTEASPPPARQFTAAPWTAILDQIGTADREVTVTPPYTVPAANIYTVWGSSLLGQRDPDSFARQLNNNTANAATAWYGGKILGTSPSSISYVTNRYFGPSGMLGEVTPGRANLQTTLPATSFLINEVNLNPAGNSDNDIFQYIEILNTNGQARSLNGYWLVLVDSFDGSANPPEEFPGVGQIIEKWDLSEMATGTNGLLLLGNNFTPGYTPFGDLVSSKTNVADPISHAADPDNNIPAATAMGNSDILHKDGFTLLLVRNLLPAVDSTPDIDGGNTGATTALTSLGTIVDQVGFDQVGKTGIGRTYATGANLRTVMPAQLVPDNFSRKLNNSTVGAAAWYGGSFPDGSGSNVGYDLTLKDDGAGPYVQWFGGFRGAGTPGLPNLAAPVTQATPPAPGSIRINEVMLNPTNKEATDSDDNGEYIELRSTSDTVSYLDELWIVVVNLAGNSGNIEASSPLSGYMTGTNGLVVMGDNYDGVGSTPYAATSYPPPLESAAFDPVASFDGNNLPNDGVAILLIRGPKTGTGNGLTLTADGLKILGDLDPENDGTLLPPADICTELVDSIATSAIDPGAGYAWISTAGFRPHHLARYISNTTASSTAAWYYGQLPQDPALVPAVDYTGNYVGNFKGSASPGRPNSSAPLAEVALGRVLLNEVHLNPSGADLNYEFVELRDTKNAERSLNGYYLMLIDNVVKNTGAVRRIWSLDGMKTGSNGLFVMGNRYPLGGVNNPWSNVMRAQTALGDTPGRDGLATSFTDGSLGDETDNQSLTLVLVRGSTRSIGYDLDDKTAGVDSDGDGVFENYAWFGGAGGVHDSIQLRSNVTPLTGPAPNPLPLAYPWNGWLYNFADLSTTYLTPPARPFFHPETFARFLGNVAPNSAGSWYGGDLDPVLGPNNGLNVKYLTSDGTHPTFPVGFVGRVTPGQPNLMQSASADVDGDGLANVIEQAIGTNPEAADASCPVVAGMIDFNGVKQATVSYPRIKGGAMVGNTYEAEAFVYNIETSVDLQSWAPAAALVAVGTPVADANGITETVTYRIDADVNTAPFRKFSRLRITTR